MNGPSLIAAPCLRLIGSIRGARAGNAYYEEWPDASIRLVLGGQLDGTALSFFGKRATGTSTIELTQPTTAGTPIMSATLSLERDDPVAKTGRWWMSDGSEGIFDLFKPDELPATPTPTTGGVQLSTLESGFWDKSIPLGATTLYLDDLRRVIAEIETHIPEPRTTRIRANEAGHIANAIASVYLNRADLPQKVREITITCSQNAPDGVVRKIISVTLSTEAGSAVNASSADELWTDAAARRTFERLRQYTSVPMEFMRRHGLSINFLLFLGLIVWVPDYPLGQRVLALLIVFVAIFAIAQVHRAIPYSRIYLDPNVPKSPIAKEFPAFIWAIVAAAITTAVANVPRLAESLSKLWGAVG